VTEQKLKKSIQQACQDEYILVKYFWACCLYIIKNHQFQIGAMSTIR